MDGVSRMLGDLQVRILGGESSKGPTYPNNNAQNLTSP